MGAPGLPALFALVNFFVFVIILVLVFFDLKLRTHRDNAGSLCRPLRGGRRMAYLRFVVMPDRACTGTLGIMRFFRSTLLYNTADL